MTGILFFLEGCYRVGGGVLCSHFMAARNKNNCHMRHSVFFFPFSYFFFFSSKIGQEKELARR